jgi:competence protein ComEC
VHRAHLLPVAVAFLGGIAAELHGIAITALGCGVALLCVPRLARPGTRAGVAVALALGVIVARFQGAPTFAAPDVRSHEYWGAVVERNGAIDVDEVVVRLDDGRRVMVAFPRVASPRARSSRVAAEVGARVRLRALFEPPDPSRNPGEPSSRELAAERGLAGRLVHPHQIAISPVDARDASLWLPRLRAWAGVRLRARLEEPYATILAGMLWGERGALPPDLRAEFQDTGTVHVLVTAGLHLGVVAALSVGLIAAFGGGRIGSSLGAIVVVWLYAIFSGAHLPSLRAATMVSFGLLARASGRSPFSWNAFAAAAIVVAALRPASIGSLSFALSFSCVGAILLFAEPLSKALERLGVPALASEALALTLATQCGTWPLTASAFLLFAPYAPLANALVVPTVGVAMLIGFAELAASPIPIFAQACANVETSLLTWIVAVVRSTADLPGAHIVTTPPPGWAIALYDLSLVGAAGLVHVRKPIWASIVVVVAIAFCIWPPRPVSHDLVVTAIDVGQADALLIRTPRGHAILVDAGGRLERGLTANGVSPAEAIGQRIVVPLLIRQGIHHLDAIVLSHPHGDHAGGLAPVLRVVGSDVLADAGQTYPGHAYHNALDVARRKHVPLVAPRPGAAWRTDDGVIFRFLGPSLPFITGSRNDINENSVVFMLEYRCPTCRRAFRMLFTGDAGAEAERRLLSDGVDLRADVLKVGHHGSAYSSTPDFIEAVHPKYAVISVGRDNVFGHPASSTIKTLSSVGARVYRTDDSGAIEIISDGQRFSAAPYLSRSLRADETEEASISANDVTFGQKNREIKIHQREAANAEPRASDRSVTESGASRRHLSL